MIRRRRPLALVVWMFAVLMWASAVQGMAVRGAVCAARRRGVLARDVLIYTIFMR